MSKLLLGTLIAAFFSVQVPSPNDLAESKWSGTLNAPDPMPGLLVFTADSMICTSGDIVLETMNYRIQGDTLLLKKLSGGSPCHDELGLYAYEIEDAILTLLPLQDSCVARTFAFSADGYKKEL